MTVTALKNFTYRHKGYLWHLEKVVFGINESNIYDKDIYIENYERHNKEVKKIFAKKHNFLSLKLTDNDVNEKLAKFINRKKEDIQIPHLNRS